jgi:hypothetical protein
MMPVISEKKLVTLLETNNWFQTGTSEQFLKLLEANANGATISDLAAIIWICSDNVSRDLITTKLQELEQKELDEFVKHLVLNGVYYDEDTLIDDPYICYEMV